VFVCLLVFCRDIISTTLRIDSGRSVAGRSSAAAHGGGSRGYARRLFSELEASLGRDLTEAAHLASLREHMLKLLDERVRLELLVLQAASTDHSAATNNNDADESRHTSSSSSSSSSGSFGSSRHERNNRSDVDRSGSHGPSARFASSSSIAASTGVLPLRPPVSSISASSAPSAAPAPTSRSATPPVQGATGTAASATHGGNSERDPSLQRSRADSGVSSISSISRSS
jgi:hypothetical protein